jgi:hypothetical protein
MTCFMRIVFTAIFGIAILKPALAEAQTPVVQYPVQNPNINPLALHYVLPTELTWKTTSEGLDVALLVGDPAKAGPYIVLARWPAHHMSHPHYHINDRFITVVSGTWWVGTGRVFRPDKTVPLPAGSFVTHYSKQIHFDGAKDEDCVIEIVGEGPAPVIPAEQK